MSAAKVIPLMKKSVSQNEYVEGYQQNLDLQELLHTMRSVQINTEKILENQVVEKQECVFITKDEHNTNIDSIIIENKMLSKELDIMKVKFNYTIPIPSIIYTVISSIALGMFSVIFFLQLSGLLKIWDIRYSFGGLFVSLGLLITAILSLKDWKVFLDEQK